MFEDEGFSGGNLNRPGFLKKNDESRPGASVPGGGSLPAGPNQPCNISDFPLGFQELGRLEIDFVSIREASTPPAPWAGP